MDSVQRYALLAFVASCAFLFLIIPIYSYLNPTLPSVSSGGSVVNNITNNITYYVNTTYNVTNNITNNVTNNIVSTLANSPSSFAGVSSVFDELCGIPATVGGAFYGAAIASGTSTLGTGNLFHPCVRTISRSTTANSGYRYTTGITSLLLRDGYYFETVLNKPAQVGNITRAYVGFHDSVALTAPVDGVYFNISNATAFGMLRNNNAQNRTAGEYNLTLNSTNWYKFSVNITSNTTTVFSIYNSTNTLGGGNTALLWQETLTSNVPRTTGRETGASLSITNVGTNTATVILTVDYLYLSYPGVLSR
jgi:hypothetical protein